LRRKVKKREYMGKKKKGEAIPCSFYKKKGGKIAYLSFNEETLDTKKSLHFSSHGEGRWRRREKITPTLSKLAIPRTGSGQPDSLLRETKRPPIIIPIPKGAQRKRREEKSSRKRGCWREGNRRFCCRQKKGSEGTSLSHGYYHLFKGSCPLYSDEGAGAFLLR